MSFFRFTFSVSTKYFPNYYFLQFHNQINQKMTSSTAKVPKVKLNNGNEIPILGLGTWKSKPGEVTQAVKDAIDVGYRHFDCAFVYQNEAEVGTAFSDKIKCGDVSREDLFITSKLWNSFHSPELVEPALKKSLSLLGLNYIDLYLIHWPITFAENGELFPKNENDKLLYKMVDHLDTWRAMEKCVDLGLVRSIGLSNFNSQQVQRIVENCRIKPVVNQVECHPYLNQKRLIEFCKERGIVITAYSPLGSPDRPWAKPEDPSLMQDPKIKEMAEQYKKSPAQLLIRYQIQRGVIVIPKSVTKSRIQENFDVFDFDITGKDMEYIDSLDCNGRFCHVTWMNDHPDFPFNIDF